MASRQQLQAHLHDKDVQIHQLERFNAALEQELTKLRKHIAETYGEEAVRTALTGRPVRRPKAPQHPQSSVPASSRTQLLSGGNSTTTTATTRYPELSKNAMQVTERLTRPKPIRMDAAAPMPSPSSRGSGAGRSVATPAVPKGVVSRLQAALCPPASGARSTAESTQRRTVAATSTPRVTATPRPVKHTTSRFTTNASRIRQPATAAPTMRTKSVMREMNMESGLASPKCELSQAPSPFDNNIIETSLSGERSINLSAVNQTHEGSMPGHTPLPSLPEVNISTPAEQQKARLPCQSVQEDNHATAREEMKAIETTAPNFPSPTKSEKALVRALLQSQDPLQVLATAIIDPSDADEDYAQKSVFNKAPRRRFRFVSMTPDEIKEQLAHCTNHHSESSRRGHSINLQPDTQPQQQESTNASSSEQMPAISNSPSVIPPVASQPQTQHPSKPTVNSSETIEEDGVGLADYYPPDQVKSRGSVSRVQAETEDSSEIFQSCIELSSANVLSEPEYSNADKQPQMPMSRGQSVLSEVESDSNVSMVLEEQFEQATEEIAGDGEEDEDQEDEALLAAAAADWLQQWMLEEEQQQQQGDDRLEVASNVNSCGTYRKPEVLAEGNDEQESTTGLDVSELPTDAGASHVAACDALMSAISKTTVPSEPYGTVAAAAKSSVASTGSGTVTHVPSRPFPADEPQESQLLPHTPNVRPRYSNARFASLSEAKNGRGVSSPGGASPVLLGTPGRFVGGLHSPSFSRTSTTPSTPRIHITNHPELCLTEIRSVSEVVEGLSRISTVVIGCIAHPTTPLSTKSPDKSRIGIASTTITSRSKLDQSDMQGDASRETSEPTTTNPEDTLVLTYPQQDEPTHHEIYEDPDLQDVEILIGCAEGPLIVNEEVFVEIEGGDANRDEGCRADISNDINDMLVEVCSIPAGESPMAASEADDGTLPHETRSVSTVTQNISLPRSVKQETPAFDDSDDDEDWNVPGYPTTPSTLETKGTSNSVYASDYRSKRPAVSPTRAAQLGLLLIGGGSGYERSPLSTTTPAKPLPSPVNQPKEHTESEAEQSSQALRNVAPVSESSLVEPSVSKERATEGEDKSATVLSPALEIQKALISQTKKIHDVQPQAPTEGESLQRFDPDSLGPSQHAAELLKDNERLLESWWELQSQLRQLERDAMQKLETLTHELERIQQRQRQRTEKGHGNHHHHHHSTRRSSAGDSDSETGSDLDSDDDLNPLPIAGGQSVIAIPKGSPTKIRELLFGNQSASSVSQTSDIIRKGITSQILGLRLPHNAWQTTNSQGLWIDLAISDEFQTPKRASQGRLSIAKPWEVITPVKLAFDSEFSAHSASDSVGATLIATSSVAVSKKPAQPFHDSVTAPSSLLSAFRPRPKSNNVFLNFSMRAVLKRLAHGFPHAPDAPLQQQQQ